MKKVSKIIITILSTLVVLLLCFMTYNSIELSSCKEELDDYKKQIETLEPYQKRYNDLINQSDDKTRDVYTENLELHKRIIELENEISTLKNTKHKPIESNSINNTTPKTKIKTKQEDQHINKPIVNVKNSRKDELIQQAINRFNKIKNYKVKINKKSNNLSEATSYVREKRNDIVSKMKELVKEDPTNKSIYEEIQRNISSETTALLVIQTSSSGEDYEPTLDAKDLADKNIDKLTKIKK